MTEKQQKMQPPKLPRRWLENSISLRRQWERLDDLEELFERRLEKKGAFAAKYYYWKDALSILLRPGLRESIHYKTSGVSMFSNYFKIALRNIKKHPGFSLINILGLALGIAVCSIILLYVQDELNFDRFHQKSDRIFRVVEIRQSPDGESRHLPFTAGPVGEKLVADLPEITAAVRLIRSGRFTVHYKNRQAHYEGDYFLADPQVFDIFDFEMLQGSPETALQEPLSVVLTESAVHKYFGDENAFGEIISTGWIGDLKVTGVLKDPPHQSHLDFSMLISLETIKGNQNWVNYLNSWDSDDFVTYVVADQPNRKEALASKVGGFLQRYRGENADVQREIYLQEIADIHFGSAHIEFDENQGKSSMAYIYIFSAIAFFIALIACINYMNLATARSMNRAKEVGIRKVIGAQRPQLIGQFLSEAILISLIALIFSLGIVRWILPYFNSFTGKTIAFDAARNALPILGILGITILAGAVSGSYPALFLSRLRPVFILKGAGKGSVSNSHLRKFLVVTQFVLSIGMIIAAIVIYNQLTFLQEKNLGFNQDELVVVDINSGNARNQFKTMKTEFQKHASVKSVSTSSRIPGDWKNITEIEVHKSGDAANQAYVMHFLGVDEQFLDTYEMKLKTGSNFSGNESLDSASVILNEQAVVAFGIKEPIGQKILVPARNFEATVVGVVQNFNFRSLHEEVGPMVLGYWNNPIRVIDYFTLRVSGQQLPATLAHLEKVHNSIDQVTPIEINFLDHRLQRFYETEIRTGTLVGIAAILTVLIACLGLFGLATYSAEQRTREIGIRKVLGASIPNLVSLLSREMTALVLIALLIAIPASWFAMNEWLQNFAYRVDIGIGTFLLAGGIALFIAWLTMSYQAVRTALKNPVQTLRYE